MSGFYFVAKDRSCPYCSFHYLNYNPVIKKKSQLLLTTMLLLTKELWHLL